MIQAVIRAAQDPDAVALRARTGAMPVSFRLLCSVIFLALAFFATAIAQNVTKPTGPLKFDIPEEPMAEALQAYSVLTGTQVMFETNSVAGYRSAPVQGELTAETALQMMLANTDLRVRYTRASAITISLASAPDIDEPPSTVLVPADIALNTLTVSGGPQPDRGRMDEYIGAVQSDIQKALKKTARGRMGDYRAEVKLWVDQARTVQRAELARSNGNQDRDTIVVSTLRGLVLSHPAPANTPQPIRFMISIRSL